MCPTFVHKNPTYSAAYSTLYPRQAIGFFMRGFRIFVEHTPSKSQYYNTKHYKYDYYVYINVVSSYVLLNTVFTEFLSFIPFIL